MEHLEGGLQVVLLQAHDVQVLSPRQDHLLGLDGLAGGGQLIAQLGGSLVFLGSGRLRHLRLDAVQHRTVVARQEVGQGFDLGPIALLGDPRRLRHARPCAPSDVVVEARAAGSMPLVEERVRARSNRKDARQRIERLPNGIRVAVRPEEPHPLSLLAAKDPGPRPGLPHRQRQVRIGLVVPIADVEPRAVGLDEVVLEHQRVDLVRGQDPLDGDRGRGHRLGPWVQRPAPVGGQALSERQRLAHVDDATIPVPEQVGPGSVRDGRCRRARDAHAAIVGGAVWPPGEDSVTRAWPPRRSRSWWGGRRT